MESGEGNQGGLELLLPITNLLFNKFVNNRKKVFLCVHVCTAQNNPSGANGLPTCPHEMGPLSL